MKKLLLIIALIFTAQEAEATQPNSWIAPIGAMIVGIAIKEISEHIVNDPTLYHGPAKIEQSVDALGSNKIRVTTTTHLPAYKDDRSISNKLKSHLTPSKLKSYTPILIASMASFAANNIVKRSCPLYTSQNFGYTLEAPYYSEGNAATNLITQITGSIVIFLTSFFSARLNPYARLERSYQPTRTTIIDVDGNGSVKIPDGIAARPDYNTQSYLTDPEIIENRVMKSVMHLGDVIYKMNKEKSHDITSYQHGCRLASLLSKIDHETWDEFCDFQIPQFVQTSNNVLNKLMLKNPDFDYRNR
jgi:hypothetical protein